MQKGEKILSVTVDSKDSVWTWALFVFLL